MRLDLDDKNQITKRAAQFFARLQHTNPFPAIVDGKDPTYSTYMSCLPEHIRNAVLTIMEDSRYTGLFEKNRSTKLVIKTGDTTQNIRFDFNEFEASSPKWENTAVVGVEHPGYEAIAVWAQRATEITRDYNRCINFIGTIVKWANTVGQLRTMFPDYVRLLPEGQQQHIAGMQKRSPLPKDVNMDYINQHRQFVAEKIALCLLLPEGSEKIWIED